MRMPWGLCLLLVVGSGAAKEPPIPYTITNGPHEAGLSRHYSGATVYEDWPRGSFDRERMQEVAPAAFESELPPPQVVPFLDEPGVVRDREGRRILRLEGEDKIFRQIDKDVREARCVLLGIGCPEEAKPDLPPRIELPIRLPPD